MSNYTNYTVVGSPVYNYGVYSGFTGTDFLVIPAELKNTSYTYITKFTTGSDVNTMQYVVHAENFYSIEIAGGNIKCWSWDSSTGGDKTLFAASPNTTYWVKSTFAGTLRTYWHSTDGTTWTQDLQFSDNGLHPEKTKYEFRIGMESWNAIDPFKGTVDMNEFKILEGNDVIWTPKTKTVINANVVGSLSIFNEDQVSGFSASSYLTLPKPFPSSTADTWEMMFRFRHYNAGNVGQRVCGALNNTSLSQIVIGIDNNKVITWMSSNGTNWNIASGNTGSTTLTGGVLYDLRARFTGSQYIIDIKPEGGTWITQITVNSSTKLNQNNSVFMLGCAELSNYLRGTFYMTTSHIDINGERWWTGKTYSNNVGSINVSKGYYTDGTHEIVMQDKKFPLREAKVNQIVGNRNKLYASSLSGTTGIHLVGNDSTPASLQGTYDVSAELSTPVYLSHGENYAISSLRDMKEPDLYGRSIVYNVNNIGGVILDQNGIASGFTGSKYLQIPYVFKPGKSTWEICFRLYMGCSAGFVWGSSTNYYQTIAGEIMSDKKLGVGLSSNGSSWNITWKNSTTVFNTNTWYYIKIEFTGTQYVISSSTDGTTWTTEGTASSYEPIYQSDSSIFHLGTMGNKGSYYSGAWDLANSYIKIAGEEVWRGAVVKSVVAAHNSAMYSGNETFWYPTDTEVDIRNFSNLDDVNTVYAKNHPGEDWSTLSLKDPDYPYDSAYVPEKRAYLSHGTQDRILGVQKEPNSLTASLTDMSATKAGSLGIGSYGNTYDYSTSNYLTIPTFDPAGEPWEVNLKVRTGADVTTNQKLFHSCVRKGQLGRFGILLTLYTTSKWNFVISNTGSSWLFDTYGTYTVLADTVYWIRFGWDGTTYYLDYSTDGTNYTRDITETHSEALYSPLTLTRLGIYSTKAENESPWLGQMYLAHCYASIDGTEVWRGFRNSNFKLNAEAVYSPSFWPGGEAYNFSANNYLRIQPALDFNAASTWEFHTKVFATSFNINQYWFSRPFTIGFNSAGKIYCFGAPQGSEITTSQGFMLNKWWYIKMSFDGSAYKIFWKPSENAEWTLAATLNSTTKVNAVTESDIGWCWVNTAQYFKGYIDLSKTFAIMDGVEVWRGANTSFPNTNWLYTGTVPITSEGIASGFSESNYLRPMINFASMAHYGAWEAGAKINMTQVGVWNALFGGASGTYLPDLYIDSSNRLAMNLSSNGSSYDITGGESVVHGTTALSANTDYWVRYGWTGTEYYAEFSTDGETFTREITLNSSTPIENTFDDFNIGFRVGSYFHGTVDLRKTYFKSGNTEVWRGSVPSTSGFVQVNSGWTGLDNTTYEFPLSYQSSDTLPYNYSVDPEYNYNSDLKGYLTVDYSSGKPVLRGLKTTAEEVGTSTAAYLGYSYEVNSTEGKGITNLTKTGIMCKAFRINAAGGSLHVFIPVNQLQDGKTYAAGSIKEHYSEVNYMSFRGLEPTTEPLTYHVAEMDYLTDANENVYDECGYVYVEWND